MSLGPFAGTRLLIPPLPSLTSRALELLADMNNSPLPIEICEHIIDSCRDPWSIYLLRRESYSTWLQTALICSAWLPRSRLNLLYEVILENASNVDLFLRTVQETPHFSDMVIRLKVHGGRTGYVPFAQMPLPLLLKKCVALDLYFVDWRVYPPRYADTGLYLWSGIGELRLDLELRILRASVRFIWSLHHLQTLRLGWSGDVEASRFVTKWRPGHQTRKCQSLRSLEFVVQYILSNASVTCIH